MKHKYVCSLQPLPLLKHRRHSITLVKSRLHRYLQTSQMFAALLTHHHLFHPPPLSPLSSTCPCSPFSRTFARRIAIFFIITNQFELKYYTRESSHYIFSSNRRKICYFVSGTNWGSGTARYMDQRPGPCWARSPSH